MITKVSIENFRSCERVSLNVASSMLALVGKNGVGKTNILHAIQLAARACIGAGSLLMLPPRDESQPVTLSLEFKIAAETYRYEGTRVGKGRTLVQLKEKLEAVSAGRVLIERSNDKLLSYWHPDELRVGVSASALAAVVQLSPPGSPAAVELAPIVDYLRSVRYYRATDAIRDHEATNPLILESTYDEWLSEPDGRFGESVALRLVHMWKEQNGARLDELKQLLGPNGLGLIDDIEVIKLDLGGAPAGPEGSETPARSRPQGWVITFVPGVGLGGAGRSFTYHGLSAGTRRVIQILTYLVFDDAAVVLLEQPEDSIHSGLLREMLDIMRSYSDRCQLFVTTHSTRVVNTLAPDEVRLVEAEDGITRVSELSPEQRTSAHEHLRELGTLSEYLESL